MQTGEDTAAGSDNLVLPSLRPFRVDIGQSFSLAKGV